MLSQDRYQNQNLHKQNNLGRYLYYLDNLSVEFSSKKALSSLQLGIAPGEFVFVTGPSGAGKTTLLKVLGQKISPDSGRFIVTPTYKDDFFIANIFQDLYLIEDLSCLDNLFVSYDPDIYVDKKEFDQNVKDLCQLFDIQNDLKRKIHCCNG